MSASSLSVATAAIAASSHSLSSTSLDHLSLHFLPCVAKPTIKTPPKLRRSLNYTPFSSLARFLINCASTAFDNVEMNREEDDAESTPQDTVSQGERIEEENQASQSLEAGRLYVGNLPFSITSSQLSEIFADAGRVVSVEVVYGRGTDRSRGFAFVTMGSVEEAQEAIRLFDGAQIGGRNAKVNFPEVPRGGEREVMSLKARSSNKSFVDSTHKIYAANLGWSLTSQALRETFAQQPGFVSAKVIFDRDSGRSRGFGFITFSSAEEVESALKALNGVEVEGRPLRLELAGQRSPPSAV